MTRQKIAGLGLAVGILAAFGVIYSMNAKTTSGSLQQNQPTMEMLWQSYPDLKSLTKQANYVILGKLENMTGTRGHPNAQGTPITDFDVTVERSMKGKLNVGDTIRVSQFGGPSPYAVSEGDPIMKAGEEYVMFLVYDPTLEAYGYLGGPQGKFLVKESKVYSMDNVDPGADFVQIKVKDKPIEDFSADISQADGGAQ